MRRRRKMKTILALLAVSLTTCLLCISLSFAQEMPKPGEVINKSNYKKYAHLFPEWFLPYFEDGYGGIVKPLSIKVSESKPNPIPKKYLELSEENRGKTTVDKDGIVRGYNLQGFPFPGVKPEDKDFATKVMWNYQYRYYGDDEDITGFQAEIRKGERPTFSVYTAPWLFFYNRLYANPHPTWKTPENFFKALMFRYTEPAGMRDLMFATYRYADVMKQDDTYLYLPMLRRILRAEAGQRSVPVQGSTQALDDFYLFDGRQMEFTYEFVGAQKVLAVPGGNLDLPTERKMIKAGEMLIIPDGWELRDVYVIDIKPKDPKYPQSKKRIYLESENYSAIYYAASWDRPGKLWKVWYGDYTRWPLPDGDIATGIFRGETCVDVQFGLVNTNNQNTKPNSNLFPYNYFMPSNMLKLAR